MTGVSWPGRNELHKISPKLSQVNFDSNCLRRRLLVINDDEKWTRFLLTTDK